MYPLALLIRPRAASRSINSLALLAHRVLHMLPLPESSGGEHRRAPQLPSVCRDEGGGDVCRPLAASPASTQLSRGIYVSVQILEGEH